VVVLAHGGDVGVCLAPGGSGWRVPPAPRLGAAPGRGGSGSREKGQRIFVRALTDRTTSSVRSVKLGQDALNPLTLSAAGPSSGRQERQSPRSGGLQGSAPRRL
jgi:hypothetical protein